MIGTLARPRFPAPPPVTVAGDTESGDDNQVPGAMRSTNRAPRRPAPDRGPVAARTTRRSSWCFAVAAIAGVTVAGVARSAPAQECVGQILKLVGEDVPVTVLRNRAGFAEGKVVRMDVETMRMPLCVLHFDKGKGRYRVRLPEGSEVQLNRMYVMEASIKPPIEVICDGYTVYLAQEGGTRGSGKHPCD